VTRDRSNRLLDHLKNHEAGGSTFFANRRRNCRIRHSTRGIIIEGPPTNPTMNHRHSGVTGKTTSLWMAHILPTNTSHGVGCATEVIRIGTISGRWADEGVPAAPPFHNVSNTWSHRAIRPTTKSPATKPNGTVQNGGRASTGSNDEVERRALTVNEDGLF
jgi:hypothetical protein